MPPYLARAERLLHRRLRPELSAGAALPLGELVLWIVVFGAFYGCVMGSFGGFTGERLLQLLYSAVKVPLLLLVTFAIGLPTLFLLHTLLGLRQDFAEARRALLAAQAGLTLVLASLAPLTAFFYVSSTDYQAAVLFNAAMFAVASLSAQGILLRLYRPLVARNGRHRWLLAAWLGVYAFVGIQMAWTLRPFVGSPDAPTRLFRSDIGDNAYVVVFRLIVSVLFD